MQKVFISYSRSDEPIAKRVFEELKASGHVEPWFDKQSLLPGMAWRPAIRKAIREANYFLALISTRSASGRGFRNSELNDALEILKEFPPDQIYLIPVRLDECEMPRDELDELTWLDLFPEWVPGMTRLFSVVAPEALAKPDASGDSGDSMTSGGPSDHSSEEASDHSSDGYHYRVGLADLDLGLTNLRSVAESLNEVQSFFHFMCPELPSVREAVVNIEGFKNLAVYRIPSSFVAEHPYLSVDLVACLTRYPLAFEDGNRILYNYFAGPSAEDGRFLFVSTDQLYQFCKQAGCKFEEGLVHTLVGQLVGYFTKLRYHAETRGCVMDFCQLRSDQVFGLRNGDFCPSCREALPEGDLKASLDALLHWTY